MSASSSSVGQAEILPLVPCTECGGRVYSWIAPSGVNAGRRMYKCVNKEICGYMRSSDEYRAQLIGSQLLADQAAPVHIQQAAPAPASSVRAIREATRVPT
ncbi:uncharacterized protein [Triticum aestivum]|uniref:uncharacterized protein n=1 Tax=Triticum aestivum TaxID=4565 RepID=UPI001D02C40E|nr:uncharacterized protein LOC123043306 [Triticum aestivum]